MSKPLRTVMPKVTAFIDALRADPFFARQQIDAAIRAGIDGQQTFWASEGGIDVGTRYVVDPAKEVSVADMQMIPTKSGSKNP